VVWRVNGAAVEVLLVHRPRFDDWSLPKGKVKRSEHHAVAAVREVVEETGVRAAAGSRLPTTRYPVVLAGATVEKVVDFWAMRVLTDPGFRPGDEVDDRRWLRLTQAVRRLSYDRDRTVLRALAALRPPLRAPVVLIRHAQAGERWPIADTDRPLTPAGVLRARQLAGWLPAFAPERLISATPTRCQQTLLPLAVSSGHPVGIERVFDEDAGPHEAARRLAELSEGPATVVCSQGGLIAPTLAALTGRSPSEFHTRKGHAWVLTFADDGTLLATDQLR
jgi:8-oxo-dGTP pyrophosphatase MutT (NUDIX family)